MSRLPKPSANFFNTKTASTQAFPLFTKPFEEIFLSIERQLLSHGNLFFIIGRSRRAVQVFFSLCLIFIFSQKASLVFGQTFDLTPLPDEKVGIETFREEGPPQLGPGDLIGSPIPFPTVPGISQPESSNRLFLIWIFILPIGIGGAGLAYYLLQHRKGKGKVDLVKERDEKRKSDLKDLQTAIEAYFKIKGRYPAPAHFEEIKAGMDPLPQDPREGQRVGKEDRVFSYYYDNWDSQTNQNLDTTYRLWGFLENEDDPEAKDGKYLLTPETYGKAGITMEELAEEGFPTSLQAKPKTAALTKTPEGPAWPSTPPPFFYLSSQDKVTQMLVILLALIIFIVTLTNAYMVYRLNQIMLQLLKILGGRI